MTNTFINIPKRGDIVVKDIATKTPHYIALDSFDLSSLDTTAYEVVGVVYYREGSKVGVVYKENASNAWCGRAWWYLSGYTIDGTDRSGIISIRAASNSWASNIDKAISYNATTAAGLVSQLNTAFAADTDFAAQDWYANIEDDGTIRVHCNNTSWQQCAYNSAKSGFAMTGSVPESIALANMRRKHGGTGGEGAISNLARAIAYFTPDNSSSTYNPSSVLTSIKTGYPVCLPAYLGTSTYRSGDMCAILRETYGEGQEGWLKYLAAQHPVVPCDYGNMGQHDGKTLTKVLANKTFISSSVTAETPCCKAAAYCYNKSSETVDTGEFWLPTTEEVSRILDGVLYGTNSSRTADVLNEALYKIGGTAISNGSDLWSCCRCVTNLAWCANGNVGFFYYYSMYYSNGCVPVSLYEIA